MSPKIERRTSKGFAISERRRKAAQRQILPVSASVFEIKKPEDPALTHWKSIKDSISRTFLDDPQIRQIFDSNQKFFRRFASGRRAVTLGLDTTDYQEMTQTYFDADSPKYDPAFLDSAAEILKTITAETAKLTPRNGHKPRR